MKRSDFFTPGNVVYCSYWNSYDLVISYYHDKNGWKVNVREVIPIQDEAGSITEWRPVHNVARQHCTEPSGNDRVVTNIWPEK